MKPVKYRDGSCSRELDDEDEKEMNELLSCCKNVNDETAITDECKNLYKLTQVCEEAFKDCDPVVQDTIFEVLVAKVYTTIDKILVIVC